MTPSEYKAVREKAGLTLQEAAAQLGTDQSTIWRREKGETRITKEMEIAIRSLKGKK
jgi:transcriptional regulator with XRE-family HTH domain